MRARTSAQAERGAWRALLVKVDASEGDTPNGCWLEAPPLFNSSFIYVMSLAGQVDAASMLRVPGA